MTEINKDVAAGISLHKKSEKQENPFRNRLAGEPAGPQMLVTHLVQKLHYLESLRN